MIPDPIKKFIEAFSKLPSFGPRLATRLSFFLLNLDKATFHELETSLADLSRVNRCEHCFFFKDASKKWCDICANPAREKNVIALVEKETDVLALERTGKFKGQYLVVSELPERGTLETIHKLRIAALKNRIMKELGGKAKEIIVAVNPNTFGDFLFGIIKEECKELAEHITRLGRGIPTGGEIEFADEETLSSALERRQE